MTASLANRNCLMKNEHTKDEEQLHCDVTAHSATADQGMVAAALIVANKADVIRHGHGHVEGGQQDEPVPQGLGNAVVQQDQTGLLHSCHLVLGQGRFLKHTLKKRTQIHRENKILGAF